MKLLLTTILATASSNYAFTISSSHDALSRKLYVLAEPEILSNSDVRAEESQTNADLNPAMGKTSINPDMSESNVSEMILEFPVDLKSSTESAFVDPRIQIQP
jgi:hypothetical protein